MRSIAFVPGGDLRRTRTPTMGTGIPRSILLNYEAIMERKVNIFYLRWQLTA